MNYLTNLIIGLFKVTHKHRWNTTHTNRWQHATSQKCKCGEVRKFSYKLNADEINGMPWDKGDWLYSDGTREDYSSSGKGFYSQR